MPVESPDPNVVVAAAIDQAERLDASALRAWLEAFAPKLDPDVRAGVAAALPAAFADRKPAVGTQNLRLLLDHLATARSDGDGGPDADVKRAWASARAEDACRQHVADLKKKERGLFAAQRVAELFDAPAPCRRARLLVFSPDGMALLLAAVQKEDAMRGLRLLPADARAFWLAVTDHGGGHMPVFATAARLGCIAVILGSAVGVRYGFVPGTRWAVGLGVAAIVAFALFAAGAARAGRHAEREARSRS
jgi:hypothetical protein